MNDLISRAAAIEYLMTNMGWHDEDGYEVDDVDEKRKVITDLVNGIPAVDAVPVVRCKDCKYYNFKDGSITLSNGKEMRLEWECDLTGYDMGENWYCAEGERRDDDSKDA